MDDDEERRTSTGLSRALLGTAAVAAAGGLAYLFTRSQREDAGDRLIDDGPPSAARGSAAKGAPIQRTVTVNRPREELYAFWRDFTNLPRFMDNIRSVEILDAKRSRWVIEGPAGSTVETVNRIVEERPGALIAWQSEAGAVPNQGRIEFLDAPPGRGTRVRAALIYEAPAGAIGRAVAKVLQREPNVQARRDLRRFKQLMETGEVTSSASPSARRSETPTEQAL